MTAVAPPPLEGAAQGAPEAIQVADRWHLIHNLSQAVERTVSTLRRFLQPAADPDQPDEPPAEETAAPPPESAAEGQLAQRTRARHAEVHTLVAQGLGVYVIARRLNLDPKTVRRYADAPDLTELLAAGRAGMRSSMLDSFNPIYCSVAPKA